MTFGRIVHGFSFRTYSKSRACRNDPDGLTLADNQWRKELVAPQWLAHAQGIAQCLADRSLRIGQYPGGQIGKISSRRGKVASRNRLASHQGACRTYIGTGNRYPDRNQDAPDVGSQAANPNVRFAAQACSWRRKGLMRRTRRQSTDIQFPHGDFYLAGGALGLQSYVAFSSVDNEIVFRCFDEQSRG